ncbi:MAG: DUF6531 domain-containing protein [Halobacteriovoraceae bacterium]|nr:DUF6531 domain-containing protein [Halobacteriovoraceae bacterium]
MRLIAIFLFLFLLPDVVFSGVNYKNGNFYRSFTVIKRPGGGRDLKIDITYNSKATRKGIFGFGIGSDFETYAEIMADGSVVIFENGSGARTRFTPRKKINGKAAAQKIVSEMRKKNMVSRKLAKTLTKKLADNAELRHAYAQKYGVKAKLAKGVVLYSNKRGLQELHVLGNGFKRIYSDQKVQYFDNKGFLVKIQDKYGHTIHLAYKNKRMVTIKDSQARQIFIDWYSHGKVKSLSTLGKRKTTFKYSGDDLIQISDAAGNVYKFTYDSSHNMTSIKYKDGSKYKISYEKKTQFVSQLIDRDGKKIQYKYKSNPKNSRRHYWTLITRKGRRGKKVVDRYEYEIKVKPDGSQYTYRTVTIINNFKTETVYSECCSLPLKIARGKQVTNFAYNSKGLLTKKTSSNGKFVNLEYHKTLNKVTKVVNNQGWTSFKYDKKGNLSKAANNKGMTVLLVYNRKGRIDKMVDYNKKTKAKKVLNFQYNAFGKPVVITMNKVGSIKVTYNNYGAIKKVTSSQGRKMAIQVTRVFQSLIEIVRPAGVSLT